MLVYVIVLQIFIATHLIILTDFPPVTFFS